MNIPKQYILWQLEIHCFILQNMAFIARVETLENNLFTQSMEM